MAAAKLRWTQFLPKVARGGLRGVKGDLGSSAKSAMRGRCRSTGQGALLQTGFPPGRRIYSADSQANTRLEGEPAAPANRETRWQRGRRPHGWLALVPPCGSGCAMNLNET